MSKKKSGLLIAFGAMLGGAVAAGISYYLKLKSFNDELDQDFHEYEEEETPSEETEEKTEPAPERTYITINSGKDTNAADDSVKKEETKDSEGKIGDRRNQNRIFPESQERTKLKRSGIQRHLCVGQ